MATDISPLLDRVKEQTAICYPIPNSTFKSDWDVVEAIVLTVLDAKIEDVYKHVKGRHRDKEKSYDLLPFLCPAQRQCRQVFWQLPKTIQISPTCYSIVPH